MSRTASSRTSEDVVLWREQQFLKLGFERGDAILLAEEAVDWHQAERLVQEGCPHQLAMLLLLPMPHERPAAAR